MSHSSRPPAWRLIPGALIGAIALASAPCSAGAPVVTGANSGGRTSGVDLAFWRADSTSPGLGTLGWRPSAPTWADLAAPHPSAAEIDGLGAAEALAATSPAPPMPLPAWPQMAADSLVLQEPAVSAVPEPAPQALLLGGLLILTILRLHRRRTALR